MSPSVYPHLANLVLALHVALVAFVAGGLLLVLAGNVRGWQWVNGLAFRGAHAAAIGVVVAEAWLGLTCPLTTLELWLRARGGQAVYAGDFIEHWLSAVLYVDAPAWVFTVAYTAFGLLVAWTWLRWPPRRLR